MKHLTKYLTVFLLIISSLFVISGCGKKNNPNTLNVIKSFSVEDTLTHVSNKTARVVILYGQSNATGCSKSDFLKEKNSTDYKALKSGYSNVYINYITENGSNSSNNKFVKCTLGCGASSEYFGPEAGIARKLSSKFSGEKVFIIKYSWGGSCLDNQWLNGDYDRGHMYEGAINFTKTSLDYLVQIGYQLDILGICWMQGESDAISYSKRYYENTNNFVNFLRTDLKCYQEVIPFIDAGISQVWANYQVVNKAKIDFSNKSDYNIYIPTIAMGLTTDLEPAETPDIAHYDSESMVKLGEEFGNELIYLSEDSKLIIQKQF